jgi:AcrR family transcriptional regulator
MANSAWLGADGRYRGMANFTKQAIKQSLMKLLNEKPSGKITVKDIVEDCGINRNSFYYHYSDIPSLIEEIIQDEADLIVAEHRTLDSLEECFDIAADFVSANRQAALYLYRSTSRDTFERYLMNVCRYVVETYVNTVFEGTDLQDGDRARLVRYYRCLCFGFLLDWLESGMRDDTHQLKRDFQRLCQLKKEMYAQIQQAEEAAD